jgi:hypothetical protein
VVSLSLQHRARQTLNLPLPSDLMARFELLFHDLTRRAQIIPLTTTRKETSWMNSNTSWRRTPQTSRMPRTVPIGCLTREKLNLLIPHMCFALRLIDTHFSACLRSISASTLCFQQRMARNPQMTFDGRLCTRCICSVDTADCVKSGDISGHLGTHQRCGNFGHAQLHLTSRVSEPR